MLASVINVIRKRPVLLSYILLLSSVLVFLQYNNPLMPIFGGMKATDGGFFLDVLVYVLKVVFYPAMLFNIAKYTVIAVVGAAVISGLLFSGYAYVLMNALQNRPKKNGEFLYGFKKLSFKTIKTTLLFLTSCVLFALYISVSSVPAIVVTRGWVSGNMSYMLLALVLDVLTAVIIFFSFMFFRASAIFWIPAVIYGEKKYIQVSREIARRHFWTIVKALFSFDVIFCLVNSLFFFAVLRYPYALSLYGAYWVFINLFIVFFVIYIFDAYLKFSQTDK